MRHAAIPAQRQPIRVALLSSLTAALLGACTLPEPDPLDDPTRYPPRRPDPPAAHPQRVAQVGFERQAAFEVCSPPNCPTVTRKTLAAHRPVDDRPLNSPQTPAPSLPVSPAPTPAPADIVVAPQAMARAPVAQPAALAPPAAPTTAPAKPTAPVAQPRKLTLLFNSNSAELTAGHRGQLQGALGELRRAERLIISGRTDDQGSERLNQALAVSRALAIRRELLNLAPDLPARIEIDARGRCCYVATNKDEDGRARNRRVELVYAPSTAPS